MGVTRLVAIAILGMLAVPGVAAAKSATFTGSVQQASRESYVPAPTIKFGVRMKKGKPVEIFPFVVHNTWFPCSDGKFRYPGGYSETRSKVEASMSFPVRKWRFKYTDPVYYAMTATGRITKRGQASGTVRLTTRLTVSDPDTGEDVPVRCDSGPLRWTAKKR